MPRVLRPLRTTVGELVRWGVDAMPWIGRFPEPAIVARASAALRRRGRERLRRAFVRIALGMARRRQECAARTAGTHARIPARARMATTDPTAESRVGFDTQPSLRGRAHASVSMYAPLPR